MYKRQLDFKAKGVDMLLCTGGMSVDPDDRTPGAIRDTGAEIVCYGAPVLPGAMFLLGYFEDGVPVMGLPGCVMYAKATVFDLMPVSYTHLGDFFGSRQHGLPELHIADLGADMNVLKSAQAAAQALLRADPGLRSPENTQLRGRAEELIARSGGRFN